jgi:phosphoenolpyruvate carboxykinase (ATP)
VPTQCPGVPDEILIPRNTWDDTTAYDETARKLASLFNEHFEQYESGASEAIVAAGPVAA